MKDPSTAVVCSGALTGRMLGQKKMREDGLNTTTAHEFFTLYPDLWDLLLAQVTQGAQEQEGGRLGLHPTLFPALTILARLGPGVPSPQTDR